jgi:hypothetical protein
MSDAPGSTVAGRPPNSGPRPPLRRPMQRRTASLVAGLRWDTCRRRGRGTQPMRPGETIQAPHVTCRQSAASSGGELLSAAARQHDARAPFSDRQRTRPPPPSSTSIRALTTAANTTAANGQPRRARARPRRRAQRVESDASDRPQPARGTPSSARRPDRLAVYMGCRPHRPEGPVRCGTLPSPSVIRTPDRRLLLGRPSGRLPMIARDARPSVPERVPAGCRHGRSLAEE